MRLMFLDYDTIITKLRAQPDAATLERLVDAARAAHESAPKKRGVRPLPFSATFPGAVHRVLCDEAARVTLRAEDALTHGDPLYLFAWTIAQTLMEREDLDALTIAGQAYMERGDAARLAAKQAQTAEYENRLRRADSITSALPKDAPKTACPECVGRGWILIRSGEHGLCVQACDCGIMNDDEDAADVAEPVLDKFMKPLAPGWRVRRGTAIERAARGLANAMTNDGTLTAKVGDVLTPDGLEAFGTLVTALMAPNEGATS